MPEEPMSLFGWLLGCCVSDERNRARDLAISAAAVFASGMVASVFTLYLVEAFHLL